jgi:tRNA modification GTPase
MDPIVSAATRLISQPVGIVRLSGMNLFPVFSAIIATPIEDPEPRKVYRIRVKDVEGRIIDDGLLLYFRSPQSLTGEDVIELQLHGNPHSLRKVISHAIHLGARQARPGEFLYRAYLHHKISLLKAESLNRLIQAPSFEDYRAQFKEYSGEVDSPFESIRQRWTDLLALFYMALDHADEDIDVVHTDVIRRRIDDLLDGIRSLREGYRRSKNRRKGFSVLITGPVNSGKSSLFNKLLGDSRALVSDIPGTTRDLLEGRISSEHGDIILLDSAGIRNTGDQIEKQGIRRAIRESRHVSLILWVNSPDIYFDPSDVLKDRKGGVVRIWNKCDLRASVKGQCDFEVSSRTRKGISRLYQFLEEKAALYYQEESDGENRGEGLPSSQRQYIFLARLSQYLLTLKDSLEHRSWEILLHDLERYNQEMQLAMGIVTHQMIYDRVFQSFCIGK